MQYTAALQPAVRWAHKFAWLVLRVNMMTLGFLYRGRNHVCVIKKSPSFVAVGAVAGGSQSACAKTDQFGLKYFNVDYLQNLCYQMQMD